ncbi:nuclear transport factor 2 family protein [Microbacteriaceae bacterium VKM Ac-2855]|nr:nuclear transport factor 2 family protein [Microbacteriaceae bacterium VKM Ac-2855]
MTSSQAATDRLDIIGVLARHAYAFDHGDAELLRSTVTPDARIDSLVDPLHPPLTVDELLALEIAPSTTHEHVLRNALVTVSTDAATVVGELGLVALELQPEGRAERRQRDATVVDTLVRSADGWRLSRRHLSLTDVEDASVAVPADRRTLIEQGGAVLAAPAFLGAAAPSAARPSAVRPSAAAPSAAGPTDARPSGTEASEVLDIETALVLHTATRDREADALSSRHLVSNVKASVDGDRAITESEFVRTVLTEEGGGILRSRTSGVEVSELHRETGGWRVVARREYVKSAANGAAEFSDGVLDAIRASAAAVAALELPQPETLGPVTDARLDIRTLLIRYSSAFDQERWQLVDTVFTTDAAFGTEAVGLQGAGAAGFVAGAQALYHDRLTGLHSIAEPVLRVEGDRAWGYTDFTTIAVHEPADGLAEHLDRLRSGGFYVDEFRRTEAGWRIARRAVAFSSSVRDTIAASEGLRERIAATRKALADA